MVNLSFRTQPQETNGNGRSRISPIFKIILLALSILITSLLVNHTHSQPLAPGGDGGTIAFLRNGQEIRLIEPDGSNERSLWQSPNPGVYGIIDLAWKPDATEIAFSSAHEAHCSIFELDIYALRPDGSDLRRITNAPTCANLAAFPKGNVTVTVQNSGGGSGPFYQQRTCTYLERANPTNTKSYLFTNSAKLIAVDLRGYEKSLRSIHTTLLQYLCIS